MNTPSHYRIALLALTACLHLTAATDARAQADTTGFNTVTGFAADSAGAFNFNSSPVGSVTGFQNGNFGGFLNDVYGIRNNALTSAARSTVGGWGSTVGGIDSHVRGTWTSDGSFDGVVMFSDHDPLLMREASPFTATEANSFNALFHGSYNLRTSETNDFYGLFVDGNGSLPAQVGINDTSPSFAFQVQAGNSIVGGGGGFLVLGSEFALHLAMDPNEIQVRTSAGDGATLYINPTGGEVQIGDSSFVGIGRNPSANTLEVEGDASKTAAGDWLANSDRRIKRDIRDLDDALEVIGRVRPVAFRYRDFYRQSNPSLGDKEYFNVIAQEFDDVFPAHVKDSGDKLPTGEPILQVDTYPAQVYSIAAIQELHELVLEKDARLEKLEATVAELRKELDEMTK